jgi:hypothetical protein
VPKHFVNITFEPKPRRIGREWHVVAIYPAGHKEHVVFGTKAEGLEWLTSDSAVAWLRARGHVELGDNFAEVTLAPAD